MEKYPNMFYDHSIYLPTRKTMHSLTPNYLAKLRFNTQWLATLRTLGEYGGKQLLFVAQLPKVLNDL